MAQGNRWRQLRILALLSILLFVALTTAQNRWRTTDWDDTLWVALHPINGDASAAARATIAALDARPYRAIEAFVRREAQRHGIGLDQPVRLHLGEPIDHLPPSPPANGAWWQIAWWSLQMRWWAWQATRDRAVPADIELFAVYHDPDAQPVLKHSYALEKALVGVAHVFASPGAQARNQVVIAHELFHTLGASDKYDRGSGQPRYPEGFAEPHRSPLLPQHRAELMGGRIPLTPSRAEMPASLDAVTVGPLTAAEIGW